jgi:hypothetical protein
VTSSIQRIVVALDASEPSAVALAVSVGLAQVLQVELVGVFVEESQLLRLVGGRFSREVEYFSGKPRPLNPDDLHRQLRLRARRARELLRKQAEERDVAWSFHTVKGRPETELRSFAKEGDLITLGERSRLPGRGPGSTVRGLIEAEGHLILVVGPRSGTGNAIRALHDGTPGADEALGVAMGLHRAGGGQVLVLAPARGERSGEELSLRLRDAGVPARVQTLRSWDASTILRALEASGPGLVVAARASVVGQPGAISSVLRRTRSPVLLVG